VALKFKSLEKALLYAGGGMVAVAIIQMILVLVGNNIYTYEACTAALLLFVGIAITSSTSMAMDEGRQYTGAAAAIVGAIGFVFGGIVSPLVGYGDIQTTTAILHIVITLAVLYTASTLRGRD
jgi:DHA1 family bicyclomycin/chloramphenicol resistance-like MFS transporter